MADTICIVGPTASGKTALAVLLAEAIGGEVVSCDSMQIYRGMDIGTAKPTKEEMRQVPHHMIDVLSPMEDCSAARFSELASRCVDEIHARGKTAILAGGTGLYIDALVSGRTFAPMPQTGRREELERMADAHGMDWMLSYLASFDPEAAARLHSADRKRVLRACEVYLETGSTITEHNRRTQELPPRYRPCWIGLDYLEREHLYARINRRVDVMLEQGLLEEIRQLLDSGVPERGTALAAIGYKEFLPALRGECTVEEAAEAVRRESRRYAKRQLTWFRRNPEIHWILLPEHPDFSAVFEEAKGILAQFQAAEAAADGDAAAVQSER